MDFITSLLISANWKDDSYDLILVIIDRLTKIIYYKSIKVIIDMSSLAKVIINMIVRYHSISKSIIMNRSLLFISKF